MEYLVKSPAKQRPYTEAEIAAVMRVMNSGKGQTQGEELAGFEAEFCQFTGAKHAFAVDNCTNALYLAATLCKVEAGDEVICPGYTFCASAIPFAKRGAKIVWCDMEKDTWCISPEDIERKITHKTRVIIAVHLLGMPCDMEKIMAIAKKHNLKVVEDCAQALDARINGQHVGTFGDYGCFSFHNAKTFTTLGEGGMLLVKDEKDAAVVPGIRFNGCCSYVEKRERDWVPAMSNVDMHMDGLWPNNFCLGEAQCAVGRAALTTLKADTDRIIAQNMRLRELLSDVPEISFNTIPEGYRHVCHQYVLHFDGSKMGKDRNDLMDLLRNKYKIYSIVQYYPLYRYPLYQKLGMGAYDCPNLEVFWDQSFSVPMWCGMSEEVLKTIADAVRGAVNDLKG